MGAAESALYSARMMLHGNGHDVREMIVGNSPEPLEVPGGPLSEADSKKAPKEGGVEGGGSVSWKRCDQVVDKGSRRGLGGSATGIDGIELDRSRIPFR